VLITKPSHVLLLAAFMMHRYKRSDKITSVTLWLWSGTLYFLVSGFVQLFCFYHLFYLTLHVFVIISYGNTDVFQTTVNQMFQPSPNVDRTQAMSATLATPAGPATTTTLSTSVPCGKP